MSELLLECHESLASVSHSESRGHPRSDSDLIQVQPRLLREPAQHSEIGPGESRYGPTVGPERDRPAPCTEALLVTGAWAWIGTAYTGRHYT